MKAIHTFIFGCLLLMSCKRDPSVSENLNTINSIKWTKVSDEVVNGLYDVKIADDNTILLLSKDYYLQLNKSFETVFKYTDFGTATVSNNEFLKGFSFFTFNVYEHDHNNFSLNYYLMEDNRIAERTSMSAKELYGVNKRILRINSMVSADNIHWSYSSIQTDAKDTIYIYAHFKDAHNITSTKIFAIPGPPLENFLFVNHNYFILYGQFSDDYIQVDLTNNLISHPPFNPKQIIKSGNKMIMLDNHENLLSSENGKDYQMVIANSDLFVNMGKLNYPTNDSLLVLSSAYQINLINIKSKGQQLVDYNGIPEPGYFPCFTYFDKLIILTNKGIYARLIK